MVHTRLKAQILLLSPPVIIKKYKKDIFVNTDFFSCPVHILLQPQHSAQTQLVVVDVL